MLKSKKRKLRINTRKVNKLYQEQIDKLIEQYSGLSNEEIYNLSSQILLKNNITKEDQLLLNALKLIIDNKEHQITNANNNSYVSYPDIRNPNFNEKIYKKKEFYIDRIPKIDSNKSIDELTKELCKFNLSNNQKFLKKFLSEKTPYNGLLLYHGTGVGKTCSSISIAEQFIDKLSMLNKKIIILLNPSIKANFIKNIFNIEKLKSGLVDAQCTGSKYLNDLNIKSPNITKSEHYDLLEKKILKLINSRYTFYGYIEFANMIEKIEGTSLKGMSESYKQKYVENKIKSIFSNTVMIIDEVHNIKEGGTTKEGKVLPSILKKITRIAENMKLVLLSATPMFDNATEIIYILNLLLMNDKRGSLKKNEIFNGNGALTTSGSRKLLEKSRGYISYMRGEHPIKFPKRLYPDIYNDDNLIKKYPTTDINNKQIEPIKNLKIIGCPMINYQLDKYKSVDIVSEEDFGPFNLNGMMASNIVFPETLANSKISDVISNAGFKNVIKKNRKKYEISDPKYNDMFKLQNLKQYSSKIAKIIENINQSEGIVFVYSQFIYAGVLALALALEHNGYSKYDNSLLSSKSKQQSDRESKYILITGDNELSLNTYQQYLKIENNNRNGEQVKVIIGSSTAAEGLDFKYIREVHVLDPWHHFNKIEQVIGRAIRNCSHIDLPLNKRNVLIYLYASTTSKNPEKEKETIDLKMYRIAEMKSQKMADVEYLLKQNAIDCNLNKEGNRFIDALYKKEYEIITSRNTKHKVSFNDNDNSKICNFKPCNYRCFPDLGDIEELDDSTYDPNLLIDNYNDIKNMVKNIIKMRLTIRLDELEKIFYSKYSKHYKDFLYLSLNKIIVNEEIIEDKIGRKGYLRKKENVFHFIPKNMKKQLVTMNNIRILSKKKIKALNISQFKDVIQTRKNKPPKIESIREKISKFNNYKLDLINKEKKYSKDYKKSLLKLFEQSSINFGYLYLDSDSKEILIRDIIHNKKEDDYNLIESNLLRKQDDVDPLMSQSNEIWGYKIAKNQEIIYYKYHNEEFKEVTEEDKMKILKVLNNNLEQEVEPSLIIGYLEEGRGNNISLKIRDKTSQGKKGTHIKTGSVCGSEGMKKGKIVDFIHYITKKNNYENYEKNQLPGKPNLCNELELYLLQKENNDSYMRYYFTMEETIERELFKKK